MKTANRLAEASEAIRRLRAFYAAAPGGPFLLFTPWSFGDLSAAGFALAGHPPLMVRFAPHAEQPAPDDVVLVDARTPDEVADFDRTLTEAYPAGALLPYGSHPALFTGGITGTAWRLLVAYRGDDPVATAAAFTGKSCPGTYV